MPRVGPRRQAIAVKLAEAGIDWVDQRAVEEKLLMRSGRANRSEMLRIMFAYAQRHMPRGWRP